VAPPGDATANYLHRCFEPIVRAIDCLGKAVGGLGLLDDALAPHLREPQGYFFSALRAADLADASIEEESDYSDTCAAEDTDPEQNVA
jgi:hypothetical protein